MSVPAVFDYHPAASVDEAIALLQQYGDEAKVLAGGHSLIPAMKLRLSQPEHLIDISKISSLSYIREEQDHIAMGALTRYVEIEQSELLRKHFPLLPEATSMVGDQQVRNRGTIGGSIAHSDPAADLPGVVLALKAEIVVQGPKGKRTIQADDFFVDTFTTALEADELLVEFRFPKPVTGTGSAYDKLANKASHYAIAGCAAVITKGQDGNCAAASIAITGATVLTVRASAVESALVGKPLSDAVITEAVSHATDGADMISDIHGSEEYRRKMASVVARRAIMRALERI
ncbi:carbon monoxide dehydrogenase [Dictyobacter alpinus]|uniref:Carbon monoxide dehydrogenase n=1 Tax=Dictyobacter alpinus TaxID=2014873 RepID=A0A402B065_9CHLR|nr:xanthine dehydrogenase family protein subunit M [Dictyobacter alpinus]GCE24745.1 carbon monoxide dehydrogenase [Dictyobacter alpinus]